MTPESSRADKVPRGCRPISPLGRDQRCHKADTGGTVVDENGGAPGQVARLPMGHLVEVRSASPKGE